ncbi:hypothetical protein, partial [Mucilaginibacter sp. JRF]|uniref:hypothetical protein n=1 Tax=Mucilaginibacter sp. JRF TaxID=2780088 RepID=UPI001D164A0D
RSQQHISTINNSKNPYKNLNNMKKSIIATALVLSTVFSSVAATNIKAGDKKDVSSADYKAGDKKDVSSADAKAGDKKDVSSAD